MKNVKKKLITVVSILIVLAIGIFAYLKLSGNVSPVEPVVVVEPTEEINPQPERKIWLANKKINNDYVGEVIFDSNLVNKSFVQAKDVYDENGDLYHFYTRSGKLVKHPNDYTGNDVYIWTNWKNMEYDFNDEGGSVFMDYRNDLLDQNIIIYGHHFSIGAGYDPKREKAFTPLEKLLKQENYEDNKYLHLLLDNETRHYELACVYVYDSNDDFYNENCQYYRTFYDFNEFDGVDDKGYYDNYIASIKKKQLYETGVDLTNSDKTLTLQTCIGGSDSEYEILVFKQVSIEYFEG